MCVCVCVTVYFIYSSFMCKYVNTVWVQVEMTAILFDCHEKYYWFFISSSLEYTWTNTEISSDEPKASSKYRLLDAERKHINIRTCIYIFLFTLDWDSSDNYCVDEGSLIKGDILSVKWMLSDATGVSK